MHEPSHIADPTDIALLEAAAKAAGIEYDRYHRYGNQLYLTTPDARAIWWDPIASHKDCALLEAALGIDVVWHEHHVTAFSPDGEPVEENYCDHPDRASARRRASTRAAALAVERSQR